MVLRARWRPAKHASLRFHQTEHFYRWQRAPGFPGLPHQQHSREWELDLRADANEWDDDFPVWPARGQHEPSRGGGALAGFLGSREQLRDCFVAGLRRDGLHGKCSGLARWTRAHENKVYDSRPGLLRWKWAWARLHVP